MQSTLHGFGDRCRARRQVIVTGDSEALSRRRYALSHRCPYFFRNRSSRTTSPLVGLSGSVPSVGAGGLAGVGTAAMGAVPLCSAGGRARSVPRPFWAAGAAPSCSLLSLSASPPISSNCKANCTAGSTKALIAVNGTATAARRRRACRR